jgi:outer membrane protein
MKQLMVILIALMSVFTVQAQKFGYVDSKYILSHLPEYVQAQAEINKLSSQWQKEIEAKYETIDKLEKAYQAEKILLTDEMRKKREGDIDQRRTEAKAMQKQKFGVDGELFQKREEMIRPIQDQIYQAIQEVASQGALMAVFDKANNSNLLYTNPKHDISDKVLKKMGLKPGETLDNESEEGGEEGEEGGGGADKPGQTKPGTTPAGRDTKSPTAPRSGGGGKQ